MMMLLFFKVSDAHRRIDSKIDDMKRELEDVKQKLKKLEDRFGCGE